MIRVLHCVYGMNRAGLETFIMNIYRNIDRSKVQFDFLVRTPKKCDYDDEIYSLGGKIYYVPSRRRGIIKSLKIIDEFFRNHNEYNIIHSHVSSLSDVTVLKMAKKYGVKCRIIHSHSTNQLGNPVHKFLHRYNQLFIKSYATDYFACSNSAAKWMYPSNLYNKKEFKIIKNGIEPEKYIYNEDIRNRKRIELGVKDKFVVGHIGRFHPVKNHKFIVDIFHEIFKRERDSFLLLVGDGEMREEIEKKVEDLGLKNNVLFTGVRTDIPDLLQAMDVFLFPSIFEGLPVTLIEAQASGLKCFVSDNVITREVNVSNLVQFISLKNSAQHWAEKILASRKYHRISTIDSIRIAGYDIREIAKELQYWYESRV